MPTYGYQCTQCRHEFQVFQSMKDDPIAICPECEGAVKRLLYPVGIVFKGTGWYVNDSRPPEKSESDSSTKPETETKAEAPKTETPKVEAKVEAPKTPSKTEAPSKP